MKLKTLLLAPAVLLLAFPAASGAAVPGDVQIAKGALLTQTDFPSGWKGERPKTPAVKCAATTAARKGASGTASSLVFSRNDKDTEVQSAAYVFRRTAAARHAYDDLRRRLPGCYATRLKDAIVAEGSFKVLSTRTRALSVARSGDATAAKRVTMKLDFMGTDVTVNTDLVTARAGRGVSLALFLNVGSAFPAKLRGTLMTAQVGRLQQLLG